MRFDKKMLSTEQKLRESEERYRVFIENFHGIVFKRYYDFSVAFFQGSVEKITGYTEDDFISERIRWNQLIHKDDYVKVQRMVDKFNNSSHRTTQREYRIIDKSGKIHWILETIQKLYDNSKEEEAVQGTIIDITEKNQAENLIIQEVNKLSELNHLKTDLIIRISHELKTPLNAIYGASQRMHEYLEKNFNAELSKYVEIIMRGGTRLKDLVSDIVDTSRIESNLMNLKVQKENLTYIVKECVKDMIHLASERNQLLHVDLKRNIYIELDRIRIEQVIMNLLSNAIKYTPPKGKIYIKLKDYGEFVDFSVRDTGIGLKEEEKKKLFKKFGKIEHYGESLGVITEGSGLGLYISKEIVRLHGGQIFVKSEGRNKGTEFKFRLFRIS